MPVTTFTGVGSPGSIGSASGGKFYSFNTITTSPQTVVGANVNRQSCTFINPGVNTLYIAPSTSRLKDD